MRTVVLASLLAVSACGQPAGLVVAPGGALSFEAARDAARLLPPGDAKKIVVRGGKHFLGETLTLDARDSGLTIEAYPGERPVLFGGKRVTGWKRDGDRFWSADLPEVKSGKWDFRLLIVNGRFCRRARLPESGEFQHLSEFKVKWMGTNGGGWQRKPTPEELTTMVYKQGDLGPWMDVRNAEVTLYHMWDESLLRVSSNDAGARKLRFLSPAGHPAGGFGVKKYVVWNVREGMTKPGQWYLDRSAGKVVYWPLPGEEMGTAEVIAPLLETVVRIAGTKDAPVRNVSLRGLAFSVTNTPAVAGGFGAGLYDGAVAIRFAESCAVLDVEVFNTAGQGIKARDTTRLAIRNANVHDTGASGIVASGEDAELTDNLVHHVGVLYPSALGLACDGSRLNISHNEVHDTPYTAVNFGGTGHRVEGNLIYRAMLELHDGAAFYTIFGRDIVVRGNLVRDIPDTGGYGSSAYYLDELSENCTVEGNVSINVARPTHNHIGRRNFIRNNIFLHRGDMLLTFPKSSGYVFEKNVLQAAGAILFEAPVDALMSMPGNVIYSAAGTVNVETTTNYDKQGRSAMEPRDGTVFTDPQLVNGPSGVYGFAAGSPAVGLGIQPVDVSGAGRREAAGQAVPATAQPRPKFTAAAAVAR